MDDSEFQRMPNPFSPFAQDQAHRRRNLFSSLKLLFMAVGLFVVATAGQAYLHRAKLAALIGDFSQSSEAEKLTRLETLLESGPDGIAGLVRAVGDPDPDVADRAYQMLIESGSRWNTLPLDRRRECQAALAGELLRLAEGLKDDHGPCSERIQTLARHAVSQWITPEPASPEDDQHPTIRRTFGEVLGYGETEVVAGDQASPQVNDGPLPIELAGSEAASWTDWPPTPLAPKLYRRPVATLTVTEEPTVVLSQFEQPASKSTSEQDDRQTEATDHAATNEARIVKPTYRAADSLSEQPMRVPGGTTATTAYWAAQLESPSRNVRLRAVTELARRGDAECFETLRRHLDQEADHGVAFRIRKVLNDSASSR